MGRVDGELDYGVTDVCLRLSRGQSLFRGAWEGDVQERGYAGWREERVPTTCHSRRWWRLTILWDIVLEELSVWLSINDGCVCKQGAVINSRRVRLLTGTARDDTCRLSCQVNGTGELAGRAGRCRGSFGQEGAGGRSQASVDWPERSSSCGRGVGEDGEGADMLRSISCSSG